MKVLTTFALGACVATAIAGAAFAQSSSSSSNMSNMSASDQATMKRCQGMSESAMKQDKQCMAWVKEHPNAMKSTTGSADTTSPASPATGDGNSQKK